MSHSNRWLLTAGLALLGAPLAAQSHPAAVDAARLTIGISIGGIFGGDLWQVDRQAVSEDQIHTDTFALRRGIKTGATFGATVSYFASPHLALVGDAMYLGLKTTDTCTLITDSGSASLQAACEGLNGGTQGTSGDVALQVGLMWRPLNQSTLQPFLKATAGLASTPSSTAEMIAYVPPDNMNTYQIYADNGVGSVRPAGTFAAGITTGAMQGLQFRVEARETFLGVRLVTGPNPTAAEQAQAVTSTRGFFSLLAGFDLVLRKSRGRRY